nr:hypothetical protein [Candidatus Sigynarchaeota archaeon]
MPIDSHADLLALAKNEAEIGLYYKKIAGAEKRLAEAREIVAKEYDELVKIKSEGKRFLEELAKKIEDVSMIKGENTGVDKSKIDKADVDVYKKEAAAFGEDGAYYAAISDAIKASTFQANNVVEKIKAIGLGYDKMADAFKQFIKADESLFVSKDKLSDKKGKMEDTKAAAGRAFDQAKADIVRRKDEFNKEVEKFYKNINDIAAKLQT